MTVPLGVRKEFQPPRFPGASLSAARRASVQQRLPKSVRAAARRSLLRRAPQKGSEVPRFPGASLSVCMRAEQCYGARAARRRAVSGARRARSAAPPRGRARRPGKRGSSVSWRVAERLYASGTVLATRAARRKAFSGARRRAEPGSARREPDAGQGSEVGVAGFEPATSASQTQHSNQAELHPERRS